MHCWLSVKSNILLAVMHLHNSDLTHKVALLIPFA